VNGEQILGVVEDSYQVTVMPPLPATQEVQATVEPITLAEIFEVKPTNDNNFTINLAGTSGAR